MPGSTNPHTAAGGAAWKRLLIAAAVCVGSATTAAGAARADDSQGELVLAPATVPVEPEMEAGVLAALNLGADVLPDIRHFAITDVRQGDGWALVSVIGLAQVRDDLTWGIDDGAWFGLALLRQQDDGGWTGAVRGSPEFAQWLAEAPEDFISPTARSDLQEAQSRTPLTAGDYVFPWQPGTSMYYGDLGIHANGFNFGDHVGWKAVDMMSYEGAPAPHAPNDLRAAQSGTVGYKCLDGNNAAIYMEGGNFFYTHLAPPGPDVGTSYSQGDSLGPLQTGSFGAQGSGCGWTQQPDGWFHVHWGFPDEDLVIGEWTLSMTTGNWTSGTESISPGDWDHWLLAPEAGPRVSGNTGVGGARLSYDAGGPQSVNADAGGAYSIPVPEGWTGSITPSLPGWRFDPPARSYENITASQATQDYAARALAQPRPANGEAVCNPVAIGVDLLLTNDTRTDGGDLDMSTFRLRLDGVNVTSQAAARVQSTAPAIRAALAYIAPALAEGVHAADFRYDDLGRTVNVNWSFTVQDAGCSQLLTAPAADEATRSLTDAPSPPGEVSGLTANDAPSGGSAPADNVRTEREPLSTESVQNGQAELAPIAPKQAARAAEPAPVLSGGPLGCLPWGLTCPRTITVKD